MGNDVLGGQAVIEGVMMMKDGRQAIAVRNSNGKVVVKREKLNLPRSKFLRLPFVRGIVNLIFMMSTGIKALNFSASVAYDEEEESSGGVAMFFTMLFSLVVALAFFKFLPLLVTKGIVSRVIFLQQNNFLPNVVDGVLKIGIFILYLVLLGRSKETRRVFEYHGAEHKVVRCSEAGEKLTAKNAKKYSRLHPRCGTAFVFGVFVISIFVFSLIPFNETTFWQNFLFRVLLLPVVVGISYEALRLSGKNENNILFRIITAPGLWMQYLTTREPDLKQLGVSCRAAKGVL